MNSVTNRIQEYATFYEAFYNETMEKVKNFASSSIQARALQGLAKASKWAGETINETVADITDNKYTIQLDKSLIENGEKLDIAKEKAVNDTVASFEALGDSGIILFTNRIDLLNMMYNRPMSMIISKDTVYLDMAA